ncbi:oligosaccharide flippase family protein [Kordiimonas aestuarii]|uniref:oligosaccharide flippase family protein n=1 Tax=Kordiimonas aestuarii TaxID=1005925 RepID=UPI0021D2E10E|nr:oligosaccharide flippase family protein [Kordiimonas aestuarii]
MKKLLSYISLLSVRGALVVGGVCFTIVLARGLSIEAFGAIMLALTIFQAMLVIGRLGFEQYTIRTVGALHETPDKTAIKAHFNAAFQSLLITSIILYAAYQAVLYFAGSHIDHNVRGHLSLLFVFLYPFNLMICFSAAMKGLRHPVWGALGELSGINALAVLPLGALMFIGNMTAQNALWSYILSCSIITVLYLVKLRGNFALTFYKKKGERKGLTAKVTPFYIVSLLDFVFLWAPILILGGFEGNEEVALFSAALRIARMTSLLVTIANTVTMPKYSSFGIKKDRDQLINLAAKSTLLTTIPAVAFSTLVLLLPEQILGIWGNDYVTASSMLGILVVAEVISVAAGPLGPLLSMATHPRSIRNLQTVGAATCVILQLSMIIWFGAIGACLAVLLNIIVINGVANFLCQRALKVNTLTLWRHILTMNNNRVTLKERRHGKQ